MPRTLQQGEIERLMGDARHLVERAIDHERRLVRLVALLDEQGDTAGQPAPRRTLDLLPRVRRLCVAAREQRQQAEALLSALTVDGTIDTAPPPARGRVLVVDDAHDTRELIVYALESAGLAPLTATNGLEGLLAAHDLRPAVILMDLNMPVLDGIEATRLLKTSPATRDAQVIAHTAQPDLLQGPLSKLFANILPKPSPPSQIVASVLRVLDSQPDSLTGSGVSQDGRRLDGGTHPPAGT